jgi:hypothetical protein
VLASGARPDSLSEQLAVMRGLLAAYDLTDDARYLDLAQNGFDTLEEGFWNGDLGMYLSHPRFEVSCYTPMDLGLMVSVLSRLAAAASDDPLRQLLIGKRLQTFVDRLADAADLQLPRISWSAMGVDSEQLRSLFAEVFARKVCLVNTPVP